jgi:hypothetical protein
MQFNAEKCFLAYSIDGRTKVVYAVAFTSFGQECILRLRKPMVRLAFADMLLMWLFQLKSDLQQLEIWEKKWQMQFNADKCFTIHLTKKRKTAEFNYTLPNRWSYQSCVCGCFHFFWAGMYIAP